jgi:hypothetical protein
MSEQTIYLTNRTASITDDDCGMKWFLSQRAGEEKGGLVPKQESAALAAGRDVHEDLAWVGESPDISTDALRERLVSIIESSTASTQAQMEILYRRLGWMVAFGLYIEPKIRELYDHVSIEKEIVLDRTPLWVAVTPDRILRSKGKGRYLVYREYKSTISASQKWLQSWKRAIQIHSSMAAVGEEMGEPVRFTQVMGLMKGYMSKGEGAPRLMHPYAWGYFNATSGEWTHDYDKARSSQWVPMPVWEYPGGVVEFFLNKDILDGFIARRSDREATIAAGIERARDDFDFRRKLFPQMTHRCEPPFGDACPYLPLCWNATWVRYPDRHPDFTARVPHHDLEMIL